MEVAPAASAERVVEKPVEASVQAPVAAPNLSSGQPTPVVLGGSSITVTKSVVGSSQSNFSLNIIGPSYPSGAVVPITSGSQVITGLVSGVYTITEVSPGAGWTTTYMATTGYSTGSSAVIALTNPITATLSGVSQITGTVYNDYNSDGQITDNGTINETGVPSVTVSAYNTAGSLVGSATTDVSGTYTITPSSVGPYRVEFSNMPNGFYPTTHGSQNGTSVQFVDEVAQATDVNFGINYPSDYCDNAPTFCMPAHHSTAGEALYWVDYTNGASAGIATTGDVGSLWGLAYQRSTDTLYAASFLRRNVDLGPMGWGQSTKEPLPTLRGRILSSLMWRRCQA